MMLISRDLTMLYRFPFAINITRYPRRPNTLHLTRHFTIPFKKLNNQPFTLIILTLFVIPVLCQTSADLQESLSLQGTPYQIQYIEKNTLDPVSTAE